METMLNDLHWLNVRQWQACCTTGDAGDSFARCDDIAHFQDALFLAHEGLGEEIEMKKDEKDDSKEDKEEITDTDHRKDNGKDEENREAIECKKDDMEKVQDTKDKKDKGDKKEEEDEKDVKKDKEDDEKADKKQDRESEDQEIPDAPCSGTKGSGKGKDAEIAAFRALENAARDRWAENNAILPNNTRVIALYGCSKVYGTILRAGYGPYAKQYRVQFDKGTDSWIDMWRCSEVVDM